MLHHSYLKPSDSININDHPCAIFCGSVVCLSAVLFLCLSVSLEDTQHTETETFLYVRTGVLLNIPGARVLPGNLSARYTGIRANPIRACTRYITLLFRVCCLSSFARAFPNALNILLHTCFHARPFCGYCNVLVVLLFLWYTYKV
jgi:hypothetical protein